MSAEETGKVPSALARSLAGMLMRLEWSGREPESVAALIDREIAKAGAFISAETLAQVIEVCQMAKERSRPHGNLHTKASAALSALRADRSEGAK